MKPKVIAHRGASFEAPENTLSAFKLAIEHAADFIECDIQFTKDYKPIIFHDKTIERTTNGSQRCFIEQIDYQEIQKLDAGRWFSSSFIHEKIPQLRELLQLSKKMGLMLEIKPSSLDLTKIVNILLSEIETYAWPHIPLFLATSDPLIFETLVKKMSLQNLMGIATDKKRVHFFLKYKVDYLALDYQLINEELLSVIPSKTTMWAWTVDHPLTARKLVKKGIEGIITNHPQIIRKIFIKNNDIDI